MRHRVAMDRAAWIDAFVMHMSMLGSRASPLVRTEMAEAHYVKASTLIKK
jgi:hypothetical protein